MNEAEALNVDYKTLKFFANELARQTTIKKVFEVEKILEPMGCIIHDYSLKDWDQKNFNYVEIHDEKNFSIAVCSELGLEMKRWILLQGFSHYILHGLRGNKPCFIKNMTEGIVVKEGLIFTLCLMMPDDLLVKMINQHMSVKEISHFFRVPEMIVEIKLNVLKKHIGE